MTTSVHKRLFTIGGAVLASAALIAGCSSGGGTTDTPASSDEGTTEESTDEDTGTDSALPDLSGQTLNVVASWSGAEQENFEAVLNNFADKTGATVNYTSFGDNGPTYIQGQLEGGTPPNVAIIPQPALMETLAKNDDIKPVSAETKAEVEKNYSQSWIDLGSVDGELYGVWFKGAN